jgi:hypothetical protein
MDPQPPPVPAAAPPAPAPSPMDPPPAATPPPAAAPPAAKTPPPLASDDPFMSRVMADMGFTVKEGKLEKAPEPPAGEPTGQSGQQGFITLGEAARFKAEREAATPEKKPEDKTPTTPPAASTPPPTPPPAKPKVEVEKGKPIEEIVEGVLKRISKQTEEPPAKPTPPPAAQPKTEGIDQSYLESLTEAQREEVELAQFAAKTMPEKYGKLPEKTVAYLKKVDEFISTKQKEDPEWDPNQDDSFSEFIEENRPSYQAGDKRKLERTMIASEVRADIEKEIQPKLDQASRVSRMQEIKPELERAIPSYRQEVAQSMASDDKSPLKAVMSKAVEKGLTEEAWKEAKAIDPLAATIAQSFTEDAVSYGKLYLEMATGVRDQVQYKSELSPNHKHNQEALLQAKLWDFIDTQESIFNQHGGNLKVIDGRTFLPRREFSALPKAEQAKHWTIGHTDVLNLLRDNAAIGAKEALEMELKRRESEGFKRNGEKQAPKTETPPASQPPPPSESPKATVTASPGAGNPPASPPSPVLMPKEQLEKLLTPGVRQWA